MIGEEIRKKQIGCTTTCDNGKTRTWGSSDAMVTSLTRPREDWNIDINSGKLGNGEETGRISRRKLTF